ncbi:DUF1127 domain-containing protein [Azospirillum sp. TSO22-1]|uniref:DUF1127 domain-containing protein n=1 Tax=Azospirillum sp. TSO22-1 TaxID=716789 RepID=UPI000D60AAA4|nr:DUF1127 domain-containing protein [Azospirillum sp. TSO22-1]PWC54595.1 hypothetical protein TSO221_08115 [Azospirillum sp. TSO22-1]
MTSTRFLPKASAPATPAWIAAAAATLKAWAGRRRQRRALALLDQRLLKDVGLSAEDAAEESRKPFWR